MSQGYACNEQNLKNAILRDNNLLQFYFGGVLTAKTPLFTALQCHRRQSIRKKEDPNHASMCIGLLCNWFTQRRKILLSTIESDKLFFIKVTHFLHWQKQSEKMPEADVKMNTNEYSYVILGISPPTNGHKHTVKKCTGLFLLSAIDRCLIINTVYLAAGFMADALQYRATAIKIGIYGCADCKRRDSICSVACCRCPCSSDTSKSEEIVVVKSF